MSSRARSGGEPDARDRRQTQDRLAIATPTVVAALQAYPRVIIAALPYSAFGWCRSRVGVGTEHRRAALPIRRVGDDSARLALVPQRLALLSQTAASSSAPVFGDSRSAGRRADRCRLPPAAHGAIERDALRPITRATRTGRGSSIRRTRRSDPRRADRQAAAAGRATQNGGCGCCAGRRLDQRCRRTGPESRPGASQALGRDARRLGRITATDSCEARSASSGRNAETRRTRCAGNRLAAAEIERPPERSRSSVAACSAEQARGLCQGSTITGGAEPQASVVRMASADLQRSRWRKPGCAARWKVMLDQEARTIAQRLGLDREVEIIAEALPGFAGPMHPVAAGLARADRSRY